MQLFYYFSNYLTFLITWNNRKVFFRSTLLGNITDVLLKAVQNSNLYVCFQYKKNHFLTPFPCPTAEFKRFVTIFTKLTDFSFRNRTDHSMQ